MVLIRALFVMQRAKANCKQEDLGYMWEHIVLNEIQGNLQTRTVNYWRDKHDHEIDFVINDRRNNALTAIECKFNILKIFKCNKDG